MRSREGKKKDEKEDEKKGKERRGGEWEEVWKPLFQGREGRV